MSVLDAAVHKLVRSSFFSHTAPVLHLFWVAKLEGVDLNLGQHFFTINICDSSLKDNDFPLIPLVGFFNVSVCYRAFRLQSILAFVVLTFGQGGQTLQIEGMSLLMERGDAGAGASPLHLVHHGFTTASKSREWRPEILG